LSVIATGPTGPIVGGGNASFTMTVTAQSRPSTVLTLTDTLPANTTFVSATPSNGTCTQAAGTLTCDLQGLAVGQSATVSLVVAPNQGALGAPLVNTATVSGAEPDPYLPNNTATTTTANVVPGADVSVANVAPTGLTLLGSNATFNVTVANSP